jgi:hypothetical protein
MEPATTEPTDPRLESMSERIERLETRLAVIERRLGYGYPATPEPEDVHTEEESERAVDRRPAVGAVEVIPLIGRTIMILGGAFVLRAATEGELLSPSVGSTLGIIYALFWLVLADRAARAGRASATFYGIAMAVIAFPLLWESTAQFGSMGPLSSAALLAGITAAGLGVCALRDLHRLAWVIGLSSAASALGLAVATRVLWPFVASLLLLALTTVWMGWYRDWRSLAGFVAVPTCSAVLMTTLVVLIGDAERTASMVSAETVLGLQLALVLVYVGSFISRTLATSRELCLGPIVMGATAAAVGLGGAIALSRSGAVPGTALGIFGFLMGAACYGASFTLIDRAATRRTNFVFYTTLALAFTVVACEAVLHGPALPVTLGLAAVSAAWIGGWRQRATLSLHGALYLVAAGVTSGAIMGSIATLSVPGTLPGPWLTPATVFTLALALLCCAFPVATHGRTWGSLVRVPRFIFLLIAVLGLAGAALTLFGRWLPLDASGQLDAGVLAVARTGILALAAVGLAWLGRSTRLAEAHWLVYPVLVVGGLKLMLEDFRVGRPATLVISLALYGAALILAPGLTRRKRRSPEMPEASR